VNQDRVVEKLRSNLQNNPDYDVIKSFKQMNIEQVAKKVKKYQVFHNTNHYLKELTHRQTAEAILAPRR